MTDLTQDAFRADGIGAGKTVVLTGATGFVGKRLMQELLDDGYRVVATSSRARISDDPRVTWVEANFGKEETHTSEFWADIFREHKVSGVINNAGVIEEMPERGATFDNVNFKPVKAIAEAAQETGVDRFIQISTMGAGLPEAGAYGYPASKRKAEAYLETQTDLNWTVVRPDIVYTAEDWGHEMSFDETTALPVIPIVGSGKQTLQPVHLDDLAKITRLLENPEVQGEILHAVGPEKVTVKDLAKFLKEQRGETFRGIQVPYFAVSAFAEQYPVGPMNKDFIDMLRDQDTRGPNPEVDPTPFADAVGTDRLTSLGEAYENAVDIKFKSSPHMKLIGLVTAEPMKLLAVAKNTVINAINDIRDAATRLFTKNEASASDPPLPCQEHDEPAPPEVDRAPVEPKAKNTQRLGRGMGM